MSERQRTSATTIAILREGADGAEASTECVELTPAAARVIAADLEELHERRAADLTPDEVTALRDLLASLDGEPRAMRSALEKALSANDGATS